MRLPKVSLKHLAQVVGVIGVAILLVYVVFAYYYFAEDQKIERIMNKYKELKLPDLKTTTKEDCLAKYSSYYLSDFYVASSAMSFLMGNQKYDYTSLEMIKNALIMGARYIELEVLNDSVGYISKPIVTTGYDQGQWQTSLNYLDFEETCRTISEFAFSREIKTHQWPLFIYLRLRIDNSPRALKQIAKILNDFFPDPRDEHKEVGNRFLSEIDPAETKICSLFNHVIIWSDPIDTTKWLKNQMSTIATYYKVVNKHSPLRLHYTALDTYQDPKNKAKSKEPKTPQDHRNETDPLTEHNRKGLTIVYPNKDEDTNSLNYPPEEGWSYGCQFVALNYQLNDGAREKYFQKFLDDSFVLKPNGLRVRTKEKVDKDLNSLSPDQPENRDQIRRQLPFLYKDQPIVLRPFEDLTKALTHSRKYLEVLEKPDDQLDIEDSFIIKKALNGNPNMISLASTKQPYQYLAIIDDNFILEDWRVKKNNREERERFSKQASLVPMNGFHYSRAVKNQSEKDDLISFYLKGFKKEIMTYHVPSQELVVKLDDKQNFDLANQGSFYLHKLPVQRMYTIRRTNGQFLKEVSSLIRGSSRDIDDKAIFEFIKESDLGLKMPSDNKYDYIHIKNESGSYWTIKHGFKLRATANRPGKFTRFYLKKHGSMYQIYYGGDRRILPLISQSDGIIKLAKSTEKNKAETYFILGQSYKKKEIEN